MTKLCPTCFGKGSIPDPKCVGVPMLYSGPNGEGCTSRERRRRGSLLRYTDLLFRQGVSSSSTIDVFS